LTRWFYAHLAQARQGARKTAIAALARKLLVALWKYVNPGVLIEGPVMKAAETRTGSKDAGP
jgi:transposase